MTRETLCLICGDPGEHDFWCPCDLQHALCVAHQDIDRKDCAFAMHHPDYAPRVPCSQGCNRYHGAKHPHSLVA